MQEFLRPIVTPFELELALTSKNWTGDYILDFTALLSSSTFGQTHVDPNKAEDDPEGPIFSSVTGTYRHPKRYNANGVTGASFGFARGTARLTRCNLRHGRSDSASVCARSAGQLLCCCQSPWECCWCVFALLDVSQARARADPRTWRRRVLVWSVVQGSGAAVWDGCTGCC